MKYLETQQQRPKVCNVGAGFIQVLEHRFNSVLGTSGNKETFVFHKYVLPCNVVERADSLLWQHINKLGLGLKPSPVIDQIIERTFHSTES